MCYNKDECIIRPGKDRGRERRRDMQSAYIEHPPQRYRLNMQVLADELEARRVGLRFYCRGEEASLSGFWPS